MRWFFFPIIMSATLGFTMTQYKKDNCQLFVKLFEFLYGTLKIYLDAIHQTYMDKPKKSYDISCLLRFRHFWVLSLKLRNASSVWSCISNNETLFLLLTYNKASSVWSCTSSIIYLHLLIPPFIVWHPVFNCFSSC